MSEGKSLHGDKSAWDTTDNADEHAKDIDDDVLKHHLPAPGNDGYTVYDDGTKWYSGPSSGSGHSHEVYVDDLEDAEAATPAHGEFLTYDDVTGVWRPTSGSSGAGAQALDDLTDVEAGSPSHGEFLTYDDVTDVWRPTSGSTPPISNLDDIGDVNAPSPDDNDVLTWDDGAGEWAPEAPTAGSGGGGGHIVEDEGTPLTQRESLNFEGAGVEATDDAGNDATIVTIPANLEWDLVTNGDSVDPGLVFMDGDVVWTKL